MSNVGNRKVNARYLKKEEVLRQKMLKEKIPSLKKPPIDSARPYSTWTPEEDKLFESQAPLVTFVVPLYNKEDFIAQTIDSICQCGYPNIEIFVVDDYSTDKSAKVALEALSKYSHIRSKVVRLRKNEGLSNARNVGYWKAKGKYIQFWDADDYYQQKSLVKLVKDMEANQCDVGMGIALREGRIIPWYEKLVQSVNVTNVRSNQDITAVPSVCFKLFRKSFLDKNKLSFVKGLFVQDFELVFRAFFLTNRVLVTPYVLGHYNMVDGSACRTFSQAKLETPFRLYELHHAFIQKQNLQQYEVFRQRLLIHHFRHFIFYVLEKRATEDHEELLNRYVELLTYLKAGLLDLVLEFPRMVIIFIAFSCREFQLALDIQKNEVTIDYGLLNILENNPLGFNKKSIRAIISIFRLRLHAQ